MMILPLHEHSHLHKTFESVAVVALESQMADLLRNLTPSPIEFGLVSFGKCALKGSRSISSCQNSSVGSLLPSAPST